MGRTSPVVTRRRLLVVSGVAAVGLLAACGEAPTPGPPSAPAASAATSAAAAPAPTSAPPAAAAAPTQAPVATTAPAPAPTAAPRAPTSGQGKRGGTYRIMGAGDVRSLDPGGAEGSEDWWSAGMLLYNFLYFYDKDGKLYADVAADMPKISADGLVYTIPLRKGVKFHNGREMKAADAKFSLEWQLWPDVYSWGKTYMDNIAGYKDVIDGKSKELSGVKVLDDYTIEVTLTKPQAVFPGLLSFSMNGIIPKEETIAAGKDFGVKTVLGTGPFKFVQWDRGQKVVFARHDGFFRTPYPYLDKIELLLKVEAPQQMLKWESGEADIARNIPPAETARVLTDAKYKTALRRVPTTGTNKLVFNFKTKPFDNLKVRQAVAMAIDKQALIKALAGSGYVLEGYYAKGMLQFDPNFKSLYPYDPQKAKALLAEAGFPSGIQGVKYYVGATPSDTNQRIQADLKAIGIQAEFAIGTRKEWRDKIRAGDVGLYGHSWSASFYDAYDFVSAYTTCVSGKTGDNDGNYCNDKIDQLVDQAEKLPISDDKRIAIYREIEDIVINKDVAMVGLYQNDGLLLSRDYIHDDFPSGIYGGWPYVERTWTEKT